MIRSWIVLPVSLVVLLLFSVLPAGATMSISLQPDTAYVQPNEEFTLDFTVDYSDSLFNGYEAVIQWDPTKLQYVGVQAGPLMPPDFWFEVAAGEDSVQIRHVITYGVFGPGVVSQLTLRAVGTEESQVTFRRATFSYGGQHYFHPILHGALVIVLDPTSGAGEPIGPDPPGFRVVPNPATFGSRICASLPAGGPVVMALFDPAGRLLRCRQIASGGSGSVVLDTDLGAFFERETLPSGMYSIVMTTNLGRASTRFVILR